MRSIAHPGSPHIARQATRSCRATPITLDLKPEGNVLDAVIAAFEDHGFVSGVAEVSGGGFQPLAYVVPIIPDDGRHAAWYSETYRPPGRAAIEHAVIGLGRRNGKPFLHCHGVWRHADGTRGAGHLIFDESRFAEPVAGRAWGLSGAIFDQSLDQETDFRLFSPVAFPSAVPNGARAAVLCQIRPGEDISRAIEAIALEQGFARATVHGIGSLIGCDFIGGEPMSSVASEFLIRSGTVTAHASEIDIAVVDLQRKIFEGRIVRGTNPVCITAEILIVDAT